METTARAQERFYKSLSAKIVQKLLTGLKCQRERKLDKVVIMFFLKSASYSAALHPSCLSGMADPAALTQAVSAFQACHFIGMPECEVSSVDQSVIGSLLSCQP